MNQREENGEVGYEALSPKDRMGDEGEDDSVKVLHFLYTATCARALEFDSPVDSQGGELTATIRTMAESLSSNSAGFTALWTAAEDGHSTFHVGNTGSNPVGDTTGFASPRVILTTAGPEACAPNRLR
jgi:hypothetical protein